MLGKLLFGGAGNAYVSFCPSTPQVEEYKIYFSVDGCAPHKVFGGPNIYKMNPGEHKIELISDNGEQWYLNAEVGVNEMLTVHVEISNRDIVEVRGQVGKAIPGASFYSIKL